MRLLLSIPLALLGSMAGSALRGGLKVAENRLEGSADAGTETIAINGSPAAALAGGLIGAVFGLQSAFWSGAVLGAAGTERFDSRLMGMVGVDLDAMLARARAMGGPDAGAIEDAPDSPVEPD